MTLKAWDDERVTDYDLNANFGKVGGWSIFNNISSAGGSIPNTGGTDCVDESNVDTTNTDGVICQTGKTFIAGGTIYDNIDDSSISAVKWTTSATAGTVTENTESINFATNAGTTADLEITSDGSTPLNMNSGTTYVLFDMGDYTGAEASHETTINITNNTTTVAVYTTTGDISRKAFLLRVNASTDTADLWEHTAANTWNSLASGIDISSVTTNKYFRMRFRHTGSTGAATARLYKICNYTTDSDSELVTTAATLTGTLTDAFGTGAQYKNGSTDATFEVSLNNGTNYTSVDEGAITSIGTSGTQKKVKAILKTNNSATPDEMKYLVGYAQ